MRALVIGGTSGLGLEVTKILIEEGQNICFTGRCQETIDHFEKMFNRLASQTIKGICFDLTTDDPAVLRKRVINTLGGLDHIYIMAGASNKMRDFLYLSPLEGKNFAQTNFVGPVSLILEFLPLAVESKGNLAIASSVATCRPRPSNTVYASSKSALEFFCKGVSYYLMNRSVGLQVYRLGFMKTRMTTGQKNLIPFADPKTIANTIVRRSRASNIGFYTLPRWWFFLCVGFQLIPGRFLSRKENEGQ